MPREPRVGEFPAVGRRGASPELGRRGWGRWGHEVGFFPLHITENAANLPCLSFPAGTKV